MINKLISIGVVFICLSSCDSVSQRDIVQDGAVVEKLAGDFAFTEGPASDSKGNVYFTDQPNDRIMKWSTDNKLTTWMQPSGRSNGLCFDKNDRLWSCADEHNELWIIDKNKEVEVLLDSYEEGKLNGPNDVWIAPNGDAYFTDPFYKRPWWDRDTTQQDGQCVYYLPAGSKDAIRVSDELLQPNGIIGSPDGKSLYVADLKAGKTYFFAIQKDGSLADIKLFCDMGSDGMTLDNKGNLYLTNKQGVTIFDPDGQEIKNIPIPEPWTANVCFGDSDMKSLFITAKEGFYRIRMNVKGVGSQ